MSEAPPGPIWLALHPLLIGVLAGALAGAPSLGIIVGVAMTPLLSERDDPEVAGAATFGAVLVAAHLSAAQGLGGILNESWIASSLALASMLIPQVLLAQVPPTLPGRALKAGVTLLVVLAVGWVLRVPSSLYGLAPWVAGALFLVGCGRLAGSPPDPDRSPRRLATALALLGCNVAGPGGVAVLPVVWLLAEQLRSREPSGRAMQGAAGLGALIAAFVLSWLPYQLPAWDHPMIQLPSGSVVVTLSQPTIVLPLFALGAGLYQAWGRARGE